MRNILLALILATPAVAAGRGRPELPAPLVLRSGWNLQSSARVTAPGSALSEASFTPSGWQAAEVPTTVLAALVRDGVYPDPYFGMNLRSIPGTGYPVRYNFSKLPMPDDSPFKAGWWYQTSFEIPAAYAGKQIWLHFEGINYRADIWMNGRRIASREQVTGMWRTYEFNVTAAARPGERNGLAVEVFAPHADDLGITWVDWNPAPPDKDMGLWRPVYLIASGPVALRHPQVETRFDLPSLAVAHLTVRATLHNASTRRVRGRLRGRFGKTEFEQAVELAAGEVRVVTFAPAQFPQLNVKDPRIWWPWELGAQNLYELKMQFEIAGKISDSSRTSFGIRQVTSRLNAQGSRQFLVNGKKVLIRGGGWAPDMMLRVRPQRMEEEIRYVRDMGLNTIRLEGKLDTDRFFALCDRYGIMVIAGWCCCDHWEKWKDWKAEDYTVAADSLRDQVRRLRNHPCLIAWLYGSDSPPPARVERLYLQGLREHHWPNPYLSSASAKPAALSGPTGVKMTGPYDWVPPDYWLLDKSLGGAHGFNTETSPGPAVPPLASLKRMLPADHLWPIDQVWNYHAGGGRFANLDLFTHALDARYGKAAGVADYAEKSQLMTYEGERAMFEAYRRNKYVSTGVVQWMLNDAWPSLIWHLYDYYLRPAGGYFGTKKACELLHVQYSYDDRSIVVTSALRRPLRDLKVAAQVYNFDLHSKFARQVTLNVGPDSATRAFTLPAIVGLSPTYFLRLTLHDAAGKLRSRNFYWLSTRPDVLDWKDSKYWYTPTSSYADFTELKDLPPARLEWSARTEERGEQNLTRVTIRNPGPHLAFFVHLRVDRGAGGEEVLPVIWQDNYFELMPGEEREITATYARKDLEGISPVVTVDGWNVSASGQTH